MKQIVVMKFGGTSVGSAERIQAVADIVADAHKTYAVAVITSAMSGVTDLLVQAAELASSKRKKQYLALVSRIQSQHFEAAAGLSLDEKAYASLCSSLETELQSLRGWLEGVYMLRELSPRARDLITSFGERMSVHLLAASLRAQSLPAEPITADRWLVTNDRFGDAQPNLAASARKCRRVVAPLTDQGIVPVVTGFMGATPSGIVTTLGRGGSDYSATVLGYCLNAHEVWIWTDVTGVMTADPRLIPHAQTVSTLSYEEASELSYFGAKVLHPFTMVPAVLRNTPIVIKNTMDPSAAGTIITRHTDTSSGSVKAITSTKQLSLITVQGKGMTGVPGTAARVFDTLARADISVLFISQASSEYTISLIVTQADGKTAARLLTAAFRSDLHERSIEKVKLREHLAIIAVVGEGMHGQPGVSGTLFASLGQHNINIVAIAQGSSERNISLVIEETDVPLAVQSIHQAFKLERSNS